MRLEKTDKSLLELEADLNYTYDWSASSSGGERLVRMYGPGFLGLQNIGSSCYMNSVMQSIISLPEVSVE